MQKQTVHCLMVYWLISAKDLGSDTIPLVSYNHAADSRITKGQLRVFMYYFALTEDLK